MNADPAFTSRSASKSGSSIGLVLLFFSIGLMETVASYYSFSRADDHAYFLEIANLGLKAIPEFDQPYFDFKAQSAGLAFYVLTGPGRLLGGDELSHLLWLRLLTLAGFLAGFVWFQNVTNPQASKVTRQKNLGLFITLVLLYPGQLAWTASLLRDGAATATFFLALVCLRRNIKVLLSVPLFAASLSLRPEYAVVLVLIATGLLIHRQIGRIGWRKMCLLTILLAFSMATHTIQVESSGFGQFAFGDDGMAYPFVSGVFDLLGYGAILAQAIFEPIPLAQPLSGSAFYVADFAFFVYVLFRCKELLGSKNSRAASLTMVILAGLWIFAYFELYVGGFSRHRLCLQVALIALITVNPKNLVSRKNANRN